MRVRENESSKYWLLVLNQLKERGLEDILIVSTDNLPGFMEAIESVYKAPTEEFALTNLSLFEEKWGKV